MPLLRNSLRDIMTGMLQEQGSKIVNLNVNAKRNGWLGKQVLAEIARVPLATEITH